MNVSVLMGRLTADPELKRTQSGIASTRFTIAVDRSFVRAGEQRQADFITVRAWRQTAEFVCKYFKKGSMIAVDGSIQTGSYEKDGKRIYTFEVIANNVSFCGKESSTSQVAVNQNENVSQESYPQATAEDFQEVTLDEDLPF